MGARSRYFRRSTSTSKSKYKNKKVTTVFGKFDSGREADRFEKLVLMERAGLISNLRRQVVFELAPAVKFDREDRKKRPLTYKADFVYDNEFNEEVIEDAKGKITAEYRIKKHLMKALLGKEIREV